LLKQRILTALVLAPSIIAAIFYFPLDFFAYLLLTIIAIGAWEWGPFMGLTTKIQRGAFTLTNVLIIGLICHYMPLGELWQVDGKLNDIAVCILWASAAWWGLSAILTGLYPKSNTLWANSTVLRGLFGYLTLIPTWVAFVALRTSDYSADNTFQGAQLIMFLFLMVWSADIGAYFVGKAIGKHKLLPKVSPGKTIEGALGGTITACIFVAIAGLFLEWPQQQLLTVLAVTAVITLISVLGDLSESMFKRQAGIKDSGSILPGHGGILDRIDSLTATAPIYALCYFYFTL
jgi:phosphatidate cytidylyltransferase